jgi:hypothetical protein
MHQRIYIVDDNMSHIYNRQLYRKIGLESSFYQWTHFPPLALTALGFLHPLLASASCAIPIISTATTATSPNAATMANIVSCKCNGRHSSTFRTLDSRRAAGFSH